LLNLSADRLDHGRRGAGSEERRATIPAQFDSHGRMILIADAHRNEKRYVVRADELLTAFESVIQTNYQTVEDLVSDSSPAHPST
jgi:hypothetical protein